MTTDPTIHLGFDLICIVVMAGMLVYSERTTPSTRRLLVFLVWLNLVLSGVDGVVKLLLGRPSVVQYLYQMAWIIVAIYVADAPLKARRARREASHGR